MASKARVFKSRLRGLTLVCCESIAGRPTGGEVKIRGETFYWRTIGPHEALYRNGGTIYPHTVLEKHQDDWVEV